MFVYMFIVWLNLTIKYVIAFLQTTIENAVELFTSEQPEL